MSTPSCTAAARSGLPDRGVSGPTRITGRRDGQLALAEAVDLEGSRGVEEAVGEARAARRRDAALGVVEDHRDPVGAEQDAGVVAEVADDVAHVEPRGEVGRDPAQRLGAAQAGARLLGRVGALDEDPERAGDGPGEPVAVVTTELDRARDDEDAPRVLAARDPHDQLVGAHARARGQARRRRGGRGSARRDSSACENRLRPGGTLRPAVIPGPSTSVARDTRPPGRSSQIPTSAAPVATRTRWQASSSAESTPLGNEAISARSASRSTPAAESVSVRSIGSVARRGMRVDVDASATAAGVSEAAAVRNRWRSTSR